MSENDDKLWAAHANGDVLRNVLVSKVVVLVVPAPISHGVRVACRAQVMAVPAQALKHLRLPMPLAAWPDGCPDRGVLGVVPHGSVCAPLCGN
jgi:hypothetical protein